MRVLRFSAHMPGSLTTIVPTCGCPMPTPQEKLLQPVDPVAIGPHRPYDASDLIPAPGLVWAYRFAANGTALAAQPTDREGGFVEWMPAARARPQGQKARLVRMSVGLAPYQVVRNHIGIPHQRQCGLR